MSGLEQFVESAEKRQEECARSNFSAHVSANDKPTWELYSTCIHCGLCLNHCPTYRVLGTEMDSPRGRIYQILQVDAGKLEIGEPFVTHIDRCLGCLACETACPSGVQYGHIVERARAQIEENYKRGFFARRVRDFFYQSVLRDFRVLSRMARAVRFYQRSGMQAIARRSGALKVLGLAEVEKLTPRIDEEFYFGEHGAMMPAEGTRRARIAFHTGCIANVAFSGLNWATARLLAKNGVDVFIFPMQRCCGALHAHGGYRADARLLARRNIKALMDAEAGGKLDAVITNSAGCGSHMKDYADLLAGDAEYGASAKAFAGKVKDVTEFLAALGMREPRFKLKKKVTYQDPCHLAHAQKVRSAPRELLQAVGAEIVEMPHADHCCGSAGSYNITQNALSMQILEKKMEDVAAVAEEVTMIVTANTGCMLQLRTGVDNKGMKLPVRHVVEVVEECY